MSAALYEIRIWRAARRTHWLPQWAWYVRRCATGDPNSTIWRTSGYMRTRRGARRKVALQIDTTTPATTCDDKENPR
jgi:hypothetical protein